MANENLKKALMESAQKEYFDIDKSETYIWEPSEKFTAEMNELVKKTKKHRVISARRILLVAAVVVLISCMMLFSSADVRNDVINYFKEHYDTHFDLEYGVDDAGDIENGHGINKIYNFSDLPQGFVQQSFTENAHSVVTVWENADEMFVLSQGDGITKRSIDNERLEHTEVVKNGVIYDVYIGDEYLLVLWTTAEYTFSVDYYGTMETDEIIGFVERIKES